MGRMKEFSAKKIIAWCLENKHTNFLNTFSSVAKETKQGHQYQVWQRSFDNVVIVRHEDLLIKLNYIHNNPLQERWKLCDRSEDYHFSSARYYLTGENSGVPIVKIS
jgi:hypothetical protein